MKSGTWTGPSTERGWEVDPLPIPFPPSPPPFNCGSWISSILPWFQTLEGHFQSQVNSMASAQGPHLWLASHHQPGPPKASA